MVYNQNTSNQQAAESTAFSILVCAGLSHFMNDMIQSVIPSIYPIIKDSYGFSFAQIGIITLFFQMMSSILQPFTGFYADRHPRPYALAIGMCFTLAGLLSLAFAGTFTLIILSVSLIGLGSSVFHPEASRVAQMASGGKKPCAVNLSSWRKRRKCPRPDSCGTRGTTVRPALNRLVLDCGCHSHTHDAAHRLLVQAPAFKCHIA